MTGETKEPRVWVVAPTLNEAENVVPLLERIRAVLPLDSHTVCVVDDGSRDGTLERIEDYRRLHPEHAVRLIVRTKKHWGSQRGGAVRTGLAAGLRDPGSQVFVEMDADLSHAPEELKHGIDSVRSGSANVAIASKYLPGSRVLRRPASRRALSLVANALTRRLIEPSISDYSNGYRFYDRAAARLICESPHRFGSPIYLSEGLAQLLAAGMKVIEFPSSYVGRWEGISKLRPIDLLKAGIAVFHIAARYHLARWRRRRSGAP